MEPELVRLVWHRAQHRCEYCQMPQDLDDTSFEIDHIIARKHDGPTTARNLCLSCLFCNSHKGSNIAGIDGKSKKLATLFNPRRHKWSRHFRWNGPTLEGLTPIGRTTIHVLNINDPFRVALRETLIAEDLFPPE